ncbi:MAG: Asp-tRNA(Asn)/Glu-tRNA(Gln) amidotransferase subunit GatB [Deltaproteobacteria bacterium]|nr:Asp-tRNA(Asn)/Glu-tRNA(Gln) amidotransferase subunit GatB [Deltaproteobacteria bacterium]MBI3391545.1 Asp-tRNA(Asn)/Glu-tRNA(Gln) amidotransferase subunit GatB [Deltaproteobacteria bacterium]
MTYEAVIGLEVHAELLTESKVFCACSAKFGAAPNEHTCPVCLGMPGVLPVLNRRVVEFAIRAGLATNCEIAHYSRWARKNYFYPDLPKGYQITQYELPLCIGGGIEIAAEDGTSKIVRLTRIHMEEDTGKNIHDAHGDASLVDFNRCGVPLLEIVSEPDIRSATEAGAYLRKLRSLLRYLEVCDGNMEEGSFRCDANVSIRPRGQKEYGTKVEVKNMNSFRAVEKAIDHELQRQTDVIEQGGRLVQETRHWDPDREVTRPSRSKEFAHDYRYFPDPDLLPLMVGDEWIASVRASLPELPEARCARFEREYGIPAYDAEVLTSRKDLADYYEAAVRAHRNPKALSNWVMGDVLRLVRERKLDDALIIREWPVPADRLAAMVALIDSGQISGKIAKTVFEEMVASGALPDRIVAEKGLTQLTDDGPIIAAIDAVIAANPTKVAEYRRGKDKLFGFFVGQIMKATQGKANPQKVNELLATKLSE